MGIMVGFFKKKKRMIIKFCSPKYIFLKNPTISTIYLVK